MFTVNNYASLRSRFISSRAAFLLAAFTVATTVFGVVSAGSAPRANAEAAAWFCPSNGELWLGPWLGDFNGRCDAPDNVSGYNRNSANIYTNERAGCVDYADVWHNIIDSWRCVPNHSIGGISIRQDGGWYRGIIRNNNTSQGGYFHGLVWFE